MESNNNDSTESYQWSEANSALLSFTFCDQTLDEEKMDKMTA